ncbi:uncharacterized protein LOC111047583 [Nilaparvata lugens]|uniref:uncharacterized protein LOC111047583 n=1 Tax=Nilaparvata lugens TaxID=108931 RepID=UPI00193E0849|nr:uncharacterized protein LOC111047583 [Nilaparvata lugens]
MTQKANGVEIGYIKLHGNAIPTSANMPRTKLRYLLIFLTAVVIVTIHHGQKYLLRPRLESMVHYHKDIYADSRDPEVACHYPILQPFEPSILPHVKVADPIRCFSRTLVLTLVDKRGHLLYNRTALVEAGYDVNASSLQCVYQAITRAPDDDFNVVYGEEAQMTGDDQLTPEFQHNQLIINQSESFLPCRLVHHYQNDKELGVAVIGLDSMSRLNFMRQLSISYKFITETVGGNVLLGFNKVGENTFPNVIPMLTGYPAPPSHFDNFKGWPFIWDLFKEAGAATMYSEDLPEFNMFDYLYTGILSQPTLHYMRTYWLAVENSILYKTSSSFCLGPQPKHLIFFEYLKSFLEVYKDSPVFLFSLFNEVSHDYVNTVGAIDDDFYTFLERCYRENLFNRTVTLVLGDHGNRIDGIRRTDVGRIEDMMPMVSIILPPWVDTVYPKWRPALRENMRRFTSTFDLHATFEHVLSTLESSKTVPRNLGFEKMSEYNRRHFNGSRRGVSLFEPVPKTRDCDDVGVPEYFCVCEKNEQKVSNEDPRGIAAAQTMVDHFNNVLLAKHKSQCAEQKLQSVERAVIIKKNEQNFKVRVRFRTEPGNGVFEATVDGYNKLGEMVYRTNGEVFRINRYGDQANCLAKEFRANSTIIRGICFCL